MALLPVAVERSLVIAADQTLPRQEHVCGVENPVPVGLVAADLKSDAKSVGKGAKAVQVIRRHLGRHAGQRIRVEVPGQIALGENQIIDGPVPRVFADCLDLLHQLFGVSGSARALPEAKG